MYLTEMEIVTGLASRSLEVELKNLTKLGLLISLPDRSRIYYSANPRHVLYPELCSMVQKVAGPKAHLREALAFNGIEFAFLSPCRSDELSIPVGANLLVICRENLLPIESKVLDATMVHLGDRSRIRVATLDELRLSSGSDDVLASELRGPKNFVIGREDRFLTALGLIQDGDEGNSTPRDRIQ